MQALTSLMHVLQWSMHAYKKITSMLAKSTHLHVVLQQSTQNTSCGLQASEENLWTSFGVPNGRRL